MSATDRVVAAVQAATTQHELDQALHLAAAESDRLTQARVVAWHAAHPGSHFASCTARTPYVDAEIAFARAVRAAANEARTRIPIPWTRFTECQEATR